MGIIATPFAAHAAVAAAPVHPRAAVVAAAPAAPAARGIGAVWPSRLAAPWPLPDAGLAVDGRPGRLFTEGAVAVVRGVTAADVAAGLRYLADRIEQGAEALVRVDAAFAGEAERVAPVFAAARGRATA
jgi:hypothetical protein